MPSPSFDRIAGLCALLAGLGSLVNALAFLVLRNSGSGRPPVTPITSPVM